MFWEFELSGKPRPKGSLKCLGGRSHNMVEQVEGSKEWKISMVRQIRRDLGIHPVKQGVRVIGFKKGQEIWIPETRPVAVFANFRFWPSYDDKGTIWPSHDTPYPTAAGFGDTDKLQRNLGDALEQSGLLANDSLIVRWPGEGKRWCTEGESPGSSVRVMTL